MTAKAVNSYPPVSSYFPSIAKQNTPFEVKINYGQIIDCGAPFIQNGTGSPHISNGTCTWAGWDGLNATFSCLVPKRGNYSLYSHLFSGTGSDCQESYDYIGIINVTEASLLSANLPSQAVVDQAFELGCNFGTIMDCISASMEMRGCGYLRSEGNVAVLNCSATQEGAYDIYCRQFSGSYFDCPDKSEYAGTITVNRGSSQLPSGVESSSITKPISGSFVLFWFGLTKNQWVEDIRNMQSLGMDTALMSVYYGPDYQPGQGFEKLRPFMDALYEVNQLYGGNFSFFISLPFNSRDSQGRSYISSSDMQNNQQFAAEFQAWYRTNYTDQGKPDIMQGWSFSSEPDMTQFDQSLYSILKQNAQWLKASYPSKKVLITPYLLNDGENVRQYAQFLQGAVDIFAVQDSIGSGFRSLYKSEDFFRNMSESANYGIEYWSILETFDQGKPYTFANAGPSSYQYYPFRPADSGRIITQIKLEQRYASRIISWDYQLDMSPLNLGRDNEQYGLQAALFSSYFNQAGCSNGFCNPWENYTCRQDCSIHDSDTSPPYGLVDTPELSAFMDKWKVDSSDVTLRELMEAIGLWRSGGFVF